MLRMLGATTLCACFGAALLAGAAAAQAPAQAPARPPPPPPASHDPASSPAGTYKLDPGHTSVVARIGHMNGLSISTFRFGKSAGTLTWDPKAPETMKVDVTVEPGSIMTPVAGFAEELGGATWLNAAQFPQARFVSTSVRRTGPTAGDISGNLTLMGQTRPVVIHAELVGTGKNPRGVQVIGFTGQAHIKRSDFGFGAGVPAIGDDVDLVLDGEFDLQP